MEARIAKERGKLIKRMAGYDNDEYLIRLEFGSNTGLDELEVAGDLADTEEHGRRERLCEYGINACVLASAIQFGRPADPESQIEETDGEDGESGFITSQ